MQDYCCEHLQTEYNDNDMASLSGQNGYSHRQAISVADTRQTVRTVAKVVKMVVKAK